MAMGGAAIDLKYCPPISQKPQTQENKKITLNLLRQIGFM